MKTTYIVEPGDTLWGIAARFLGSGLRWRDIWRWNSRSIVAKQPQQERYRHRRGDPDWLFPGTVLELHTCT
jgi:nucleoid-associated protein YgaU